MSPGQLIGMGEAALDIQTLRDIHEFLIELRGQWAWKEHEPRCGYQRQYHELCATLTRVEAAIDAADATLPTLKDVQAIYRGDANSSDGDNLRGQ